MFIFFDGEEAFRQWGPNDSIYGARHLAKQWQGTEYKDGANELQRMECHALARMGRLDRSDNSTENRIETTLALRFDAVQGIDTTISYKVEQ
uniref:glutaminyl-peptide cyclotransferase n=1 Tax=Spodoptera frugiperda TaxID=7108 RepID=A0A2H1WCL2_SPOFR